MTQAEVPLSNSLRIAIIAAIRRIRRRIQWRPGKDMQHLAKRIHFGHLAEGSTIVQYEEVINTVVNDGQAKVYVFQYNNMSYPTLVAIVREKKWLVMIGLDGIMETAFPPHDPDKYLSDSAFHYVSLLEELME